MMLLARNSSVEDFGVYVFAISSVQIVVLFCKQGLDSGAVRFIPAMLESDEHSEIRRFRRIANKYVNISFLPAVCITAIWLYFQSPGDMSKMSLVLFSCSAPLLVKYGVVVGELRAAFAIVYSSFYNQLATPLLLVFLATGFLVTTGWSAVGIFELAVLYFLSIVLILPVLLIATNLKYAKYCIFSTDEQTRPDRFCNSWIRTSRWFMLTDGFQRVLGLCDVIIVGIMVGAAEAAVYGVCTRLIRFVSIVRLSLSQVVAPHISRLSSTKNWIQVQKYLKKSSRISTIVAGLGLVFIYCFGQLLLGWFGDDYLVGFSILLGLAGVEIIIAMFGPSAQLLMMTGGEKEAFYITVVALIVNIILSIAMIPLIGPVGAVVGTFAGVLFQGIVRNIVAFRMIGITSSVY